MTAFLNRPDAPGMAVFDTRLGLTLLDVAGSPEDPAARLVVANLYRRAVRTTDGYVAREAFTYPLFSVLATGQEQNACRALLHACGLESGTLPEYLSELLAAALITSHGVIRRSVGFPEHACPIGEK
ncbi:hypothetical protein [Streptomyces sp. NBC_01465]|uniref:hypothetical protein n=1 Tax=Streptomyces sp. NBC_01465 TaxID=2903878 RepID=UPI002E31C3FB|nr:hypothetical protein [Streptomyces sp. NBC_01465]